MRRALAGTPARLMTGRAGPGYRTATTLKLREDHAAARDAVHAELDLPVAFGEDRLRRFGLFSVQTRATSKAEYLMRPDLGRKLSDAACDQILAECPTGPDLQVVIGDGLSATAVACQAPTLLDQMAHKCQQLGTRFGRPFVVRYCRVGVMNDIGELLRPEVVVLLIGERPGLATAESLSAYLAYRPQAGHSDADRNLISNIHGRGVPIDVAADRICALAARFRRAGRSGTGVSEQFPLTVPTLGSPSRLPP